MTCSKKPSKRLLLAIGVILCVFRMLRFDQSLSISESWNESPHVTAGNQQSEHLEKGPTRAIWEEKDAYVMSNFHENFPIQCGQRPDWHHPSISNLIDMVRFGRAPEKKNKLRFGHGGHGTDDSKADLDQVCMYDVLHRWNQLSEKLGIHDWTVHGGSAVSAKCFGAMNPWDDDIDITVGNCTRLKEAWDNGGNVTELFPDIPVSRYSESNRVSHFVGRALGNDLILSRGGRRIKWYKLMTVEQARLSTSNQILGIDMECMDWEISQREREPKKKSGWLEHLKKGGQMLKVPFGPTTVQQMPPEILDAFIQMRYGKYDPCVFPFENGQEKEPFFGVSTSDGNAGTKHFTSNRVANATYGHQRESLSTTEMRRRKNMDFAVANWYVSSRQREKWRKLAGNGQHENYTSAIPNLNAIEVDNSIALAGACQFFGGQHGSFGDLRVLGFNAARGKHWDLFAQKVRTQSELQDPHVILLSEMDIGMARSFNVHTTKRLAHELGMNYAWGLEFVELTRGTEEEQKATEGRRNALGLHGHAILSRCHIHDTMLLRDRLPAAYFSKRPESGMNADEHEIRLGGHMGLFARIFEKNPDLEDKQQRYYTVGNVHRLDESKETQRAVFDYFGFNLTNTIESPGVGVGPTEQLGVIAHGDFRSSDFCKFGGLRNQSKRGLVKCRDDGNHEIETISGSQFCTNLVTTRTTGIRKVQVSTPACFKMPGNESSPMIQLSDEPIVSIHVYGTNMNDANLMNVSILAQ